MPGRMNQAQCAFSIGTLSLSLMHVKFTLFLLQKSFRQLTFILASLAACLSAVPAGAWACLGSTCLIYGLSSQ